MNLSKTRKDVKNNVYFNNCCNSSYVWLLIGIFRSCYSTVRDVSFYFVSITSYRWRGVYTRLFVNSPKANNC